MIKAAFLGTVAAFSLVSGVITAHAADAIVETPYDPVFSFTGAYIGLQAGYAFGHENDNLSDALEGSAGNVGLSVADDFSMDGFVGGAYVGYNYQLPSNWVVGVEGDFNGSSYKGDEDYEGNPNPFTFAQGNLEMKSDWQASIRGRVGYAMDRTLFFGTAGVAFAHAELHDEGDERQPESPAFPYENSDTKTLTGYTIGLGVEHAFTDHLIGKLEARYSDFGHETFDLDRYDVEADFNQGQVLAGIAYKF